MGVGASIFGGISASKAMKKVKKNLEGQLADNEAWYDRNYNTDPTQLASAQRVMSMVDERTRRANRAAAGAAAVGGATEESMAASKAANNEALADVASRVAVAGEQRRDRVDAQYRQTKAALSNTLNNVEVNKARALTDAVAGVADAASGLDFGSVGNLTL